MKNTRDKIQGDQAIEILKCSPNELVAYMDQGKLKAFTEAGRQVFNTDITEDVDQKILNPPLAERIKASQRYAIHLMKKGRVGQENGFGDVSEFPDGWEGMSLSIPKEKQKEKEFIEKIMKLYFFEDECLNFKKNPRTIPESAFKAGCKVLPQIEKLYKKLDEYGEDRNGKAKQKWGKDLKELALDSYHHDKDSFQDIEKADLENDDIYETTTRGQRARTIKGKLLQHVIIRMTGHKPEYQSFFKECRKHLKKSTTN